MKKIRKQVITIKTFILLLLFSLSLLFCLSAVSAADNDTIYVNNNTGNDSWDGLNATWNGGTNGPKLSIKNSTGTVNNGGTVYIANGIYTGENNTNITIDRNMTIIGESQTNTIISATIPGRIFFINSDLTVNLYNLTIQNCLMPGIGENGGAIYNNGSNLNVNNYIFTNNNVAGGNGGAICNNGGNLTITGSTFTDNTNLLSGDGGAIYNIGGNLNVTSSTFTRNRSRMNGHGGAIYNNGGNLNIASSTFTSNSELMGDGGAIYNIGGNLNVTGSTFTGNTIIMNGYGGAICNVGGNLNITGSIFTGNSAVMGGGAINNDGGILEVTGSTFTSNTFNPVPGLGIIMGGGGAINIVNGNCNVTGSTFTTNTAYGGGAIFNGGNCNIAGSTFTSNSATMMGGAIINLIGTLKVTGSTFTGNTAPLGGAINNGGLSSGGNLEVTNCTFTSNTAAEVPGMPGYGGAISNFVGTLKVTYSTFTSNTAGINEGKGMGSAIFNAGGDATINFNRIVGNSPSNGEIAGERINATLNWWGSNLSPVGKINELYGGIILFDPWITLNVTADPTSIFNGGNSTVTASLLSDNQGTYHDRALGHVPDIPVTLIVPWGNFITGKTITLNTVNGNITAIFFANEGPVNSLYNPVRVNASADSYTTNALEAAYIYINPVAYLNITKTVNVTNANVGDVIRYNINIANNGPDNVTTITLKDIFPVGTGPVPVYISPPADSLIYGPLGGELTWTNILDSFGGILQPGMNVSILIDVKILPYAAGTTLYNTANITHNEYPYFNESTASVYVNLASVELNKTVNNTRPNVGETVLFTIVARNTGPSTATDLVVTDTLPVGLDFVSCTGSGVWDPITRTVTWPTSILLNGANVTYYITALVNSTSLAGINVTNVVNETHKEYPSNSTTNCTIYVPKSDLYIKITSNNKNPKVGETFTLTYKLGNYGPDPAENVTIIIPLPEGFVIGNIYGDGNRTYNPATNTITWTLKNVPVGDPYLYVQGWFTRPGAYVFGASISSDTYTVNTEGTPITINAVAVANAQTVGMQQTGLPIIGLILAILALFGGLATSKRK